MHMLHFVPVIAWRPSMGIHKQSLKTLRRIARAHGQGGHPDLASLARELGSAIHRHAATLDAELAYLRAPGRGFERWLLSHRRRAGMQLLVMAWPANHATPVHDHGGLWGLEIALYGALEVESYARDPLNGELQSRGRTWLGPGDATWFDAGEPGLHRCRNLSRNETALTLHVYGGNLAEYFAYEQAQTDQPWQAHPRHAVINGQLSA